MSDSSSVKKIGILAHVGNQNLGDEGIFAAVVQNIIRHYPGSEVYGFTVVPADTQGRHQITAFPIRRRSKDAHHSQTQMEEKCLSRKGKQPARFWVRVKASIKTTRVLYPILKIAQNGFLVFFAALQEVCFCLQSINRLKAIDLLIVAGSGQLCDHYGGPWGFPYTLLKWSILTRVVGAKIAFLSVGAGPLNASLSKIFIKHALSMASYRSYRDQSSYKLLTGIGVAGENFVFPDLAYSLEIPKAMPIPKPSNSLGIVGINPVPFFDCRYWHESDPDIYNNYIKRLASFAEWLIQRGYTVLLFPTQLRADPQVVRDMRNTIEKSGALDSNQQLLDPPISSFDDLNSWIAVTDMVVASRFHGIIFSFAQKKPVLGIAYQQKTYDLMAQVGQSDYVVDIYNLHLDSLVEKFQSLESKSAVAKREIGYRVASQQSALQEQYNRIFILLNGSTG